MRCLIKKTWMLLLPIIILLLYNFSLAYAQDHLLDGKIFLGQYTENHKKLVKEDELSFMSGEFTSLVYTHMGFGGGAYTARAELDKIYFEAVSVDTKHGSVKWHGVVVGDTIEVKFLWYKKGWFTDTEREYAFRGTLKK